MEIKSVRHTERAFGEGEIEDKQMAAGLEDAAHFSERHFVIPHVPQPEGNSDDIERARVKREVQGIGNKGFANPTGAGVL